MTSSIEKIYGDLPSDWDYISLGDLISQGKGDLQTGPFGTLLQASEYRSSGTPVIAVQNIGDNRINRGTIPKINDETLSRLAGYKLCLNDILFCRKGNIERRAIIRKEEVGWLQGSDCIRLRFKNTIDASFISYVLGTPAYRSWILRHAQGATMPSLNQEILKLIPLPLPPLPIQHTLAQILGSLDDKIELNCQMNATLEVIARTLFQSWFVDFDPVRAKADGRQPEGMDAATAALFPSEFEEINGLEVPKDWKVKPIDHIATFLNGLALQNYPPEDDDYLPVIKIAQLHKEDTEGCDKASVKIPPKYIVDNGDVIFSWSGSLEVVIWCGGKGALNQHLFKVFSEEYPKWFYYFWVKYHLPEFQAIASGKATTMGHIQRHHLSEAQCIIPSPTIFTQADKIMAPLVAEIIKNKVEARSLAAIRDTLLPKLMSGGIDVQNIKPETPA